MKTRLPESLLDSILAALPANIAVLDKDGRIVAVNDSWNKFWQENSAKACERMWVGEDYLQSIRESSIGQEERIRDGIRQVLSGESDAFQHEYHCNGNGEKKWFEVNVTPLPSDGDGVVIAHYDITRRKVNEEEQGKLIDQLKAAQDQLLQSEKMASIGQLAAGVAHEINNPVGYISSNMGSLKQYLDDLFQVLEVYEKAESSVSEEDALEAILAIKKSVDLDFLKEDLLSLIEESKEGVKRVKQIVQDLKDFSHVDEAEWQWSDIHHGLDSTLNIVWNEIKYKAEVVKEYGDIPEVECIPSQLNQVFMNLLVNAAHALDDRGTITIRTGMLDSEKVFIEIRDTGCGIPQEALNRIFEPFYTTKPVGKGTGLGLSLSYGIVEKHAGNIDVESTPGEGTCFCITLPIERKVIAEESVA